MAQDRAEGEKLQGSDRPPGAATTAPSSRFTRGKGVFKGAQALPEIRIRRQPQFFIDDYLVDNRWGIEYLTEVVTRAFHAPVKHPANPLIAERMDNNIVLLGPGGNRAIPCPALASRARAKRVSRRCAARPAAVSW